MSDGVRRATGCTLVLGPAALVAIGLALLTIAGAYAWWMRDLLNDGTTADGIVWYASHRTLWVETPSPRTGGTETIPVRRPWWPPLRRWQRDSVRIVYRASAQIPGRLILRHGRVRTWSGLWLTPIAYAAGGTVCLLFGTLALRSRRLFIGRRGRVDA